MTKREGGVERDEENEKEKDKVRGSGKGEETRYKERMRKKGKGEGKINREEEKGEENDRKIFLILLFTLHFIPISSSILYCLSVSLFCLNGDVFNR